MGLPDSPCWREQCIMGWQGGNLAEQYWWQLTWVHTDRVLVSLQGVRALWQGCIEQIHASKHRDLQVQPVGTGQPQVSWAVIHL